LIRRLGDVNGRTRSVPSTNDSKGIFDMTFSIPIFTRVWNRRKKSCVKRDPAVQRAADCGPHMKRDIGLADAQIPHLAQHHPLIVIHGIMFRFD